MRRTETATSSFDLFLDTICNTFGGIVFLAILLAVMIQNRSMLKTDDTDGQQATPEEVRQVMADLQDTTLKFERVQMELAAMPTATVVVDDSQYQSLSKQHEQLQAEITDSLGVEAALSKSLSETLARNAITRAEQQELPQKLEATKKSVAVAKADYQALVDSKQQTLRLPKVRSSTGSSVLLLVKDKSLYLAKQPSLFGPGFNQKQVTTKSGTDGSITVDPILGSGWDLQQGQGRSQFQSLVNKAKAEGNTLTIAIWPDSFDEFSALRDGMVNENVFYQLWPQSSGQSLVVFLGPGQSSVQ